MTPEDARHLLSRTGFGAAPGEIAELARLSREVAVDHVIGTLDLPLAYPMPPWADDWPYPGEMIWTLGRTVEEYFFTMRALEIEQLRRWWLREMIATPAPFRERLTLFWHDHFASSGVDHGNSQWTANQNRMFRNHAAGSFGALAHGILQDPAMLVYLDNLENHREAPNENLAREYLELFTLGEGRGYDEGDIREAARALTGNKIGELAAPGFRFNAEAHDNGVKTIFGQRGRFDGSDLAELVLENRAFGPFIVEKLWRHFVSDRTDAQEIDRLARFWRGADFELKPLLRALLLSDAFWDPGNLGRLVKGPVELAVGTIRSLGLTVHETEVLLEGLSDLGQTLFEPPNVGGWPSGTAWINDATVIARQQALTELITWRGEPDEEDDDETDHRPGMMMGGIAPSRAPASLDLGRGALRVGSVFAIHTERTTGGGLFIHLVLFDLSFAGQTWRSLPLWVEQGRSSGPIAIGLQTLDMPQDRFGLGPLDEEDEGFIEAAVDDLGDLPETIALLLRAIIGHLPELLQETRAQVIWSPLSLEDEEADEDEIEEGMNRASWRDVARFASRLARRVPPPGDLLIAPSAPGRLGLGGLSEYAGLSQDFEGTIVELEERLLATGALRPAEVFAEDADWLAALPFEGFESRRAEAALLALPLPQDGRRDEKIVEDVEALIRRIVLAPQYQLT